MEPKTPKAQLALSAELRNVINERNILTSRTKNKFISALNEIHATDMEIKRENRKNQAVQEILNSEAVYLKQLENIMNFFMKPIQEKGILKEAEFDVLFGSIYNIYKVNGELLNLLKEDLTNVAFAFSKLAPFFKMYSAYAYDFKKSLWLLETLLKENEQFNTFIGNQESRPEIQAKLSSLLITPIQRIPRYCLLLKQVLNDTFPADADYNSLKDSLEKLQNVAQHLNSLVEERENTQRLLELQRCIKNGSGLVVKPGRKLIKHGDLNWIRLGNCTEKIHLCLFSDLIMLCKHKMKYIPKASYLRCKTTLALHACKIQQNDNLKMFEIHCEERILLFYHDSGIESDEWIKAIKESIEKCIRNRKTLRKESSSRLTADKNSSRVQEFCPGVTRIKKRRRSELMEETDEDASIGNTTKLVNLNEKRDSIIAKVKKPKARMVPEETQMTKEENTEDTKLFKINKKLLSKIVKKRKPKAIMIPAETQTTNQEVTDSLFPLRRHFVNGNEENTVEVYNPNMFVFGQSNENRGFGFKLGNVFSCIGNKIKNLFGKK